MRQENQLEERAQWLDRIENQEESQTCLQSEGGTRVA